MESRAQRMVRLARELEYNRNIASSSIEQPGPSTLSADSLMDIERLIEMPLESSPNVVQITDFGNLVMMKNGDQLLALSSPVRLERFSPAEAEFIDNVQDNTDFDSDDSLRDENFEPSSELSEESSDECINDIAEIKESTITSSDPQQKNKENEISESNNEENVPNKEEIDNDKKKSRKRLRDPATWKRNIKKQKVNEGLEYVSEGGRQVAARQLKEGCGETCKLKCKTKISEKDRQNIHSNFWKLANNNCQRQFVASHMENIVPKYRRCLEGSKRGTNITYFLTSNGEKIRVCKKFFMETINIGDRFIRTTWAKKGETGAVEPDKRGWSKNRDKVDPVTKERIREHINSFERIESHYLREQTTREYLDGSLTIAQMYRYYKEQQLEKNFQVAKKSLYEHIFNTEFNISFFVPKKDQCSLCETYKNSSEEEQNRILESYENHQKNKQRAGEEKTKDIARARDNDNTIVSCFDLQSVLQTPSGDISTYYYKCRLNCFNFTLFEMVSKKGYCFFWNESLANRGSNEIASCLLLYLKENCNDKEIIFYSDNCTGQNKNKFVSSMYLYAAIHCNVKSITNKYLTVGHTQNEGDAIHSAIERQKERVLKAGPIYVPAQWPPVIKMARKEGQPYNVKEMATEEFLDFKELSQNIGNNFTMNEKGEKVVWNDIQIIHVDKEKPYMLFYKTDFDSPSYEAIDVRRKQRGRPPTLILNPAYKNPPELSQKKKNHLIYLCMKNHITKVHHPFLESLTGMKVPK